VLEKRIRERRPKTPKKIKDRVTMEKTKEPTSLWRTKVENHALRVNECNGKGGTPSKGRGDKGSGRKPLPPKVQHVIVQKGGGGKRGNFSKHRRGGEKQPRQEPPGGSSKTGGFWFPREKLKGAGERRRVEQGRKKGYIQKKQTLRRRNSRGGQHNSFSMVRGRGRGE